MMRKGSLVTKDVSSPGAVLQQDRRRVRRMSVKPEITLPVAIRCGQGTVCQGRVLNLSTKGMLVEFPKGQLPRFKLMRRSL